jgi:hypothetical protein
MQVLIVALNWKMLGFDLHMSLASSSRLIHFWHIYTVHRALRASLVPGIRPIYNLRFQTTLYYADRYLNQSLNQCGSLARDNLSCRYTLKLIFDCRKGQSPEITLARCFSDLSKTENTYYALISLCELFEARFSQFPQSSKYLW